MARNDVSIAARTQSARHPRPRVYSAVRTPGRITRPDHPLELAISLGVNSETSSRSAATPRKPSEKPDRQPSGEVFYRSEVEPVLPDEVEGYATRIDIPLGPNHDREELYEAAESRELVDEIISQADIP